MSKAKKGQLFIVAYDNGYGYVCPMGWDDACEGALSGLAGVAVFDSRADARKAIRISTAFARLCAEQGKPVNTDFTEGLKHIYIWPLARKAKQ